MRRRTLGFGDCCYHVVSRINERRFYLGESEKSHFVELLTHAAFFSGVEVLTYAIMDDHFHLLVRVPRPAVVSNRELLRRIKVLYKPDEYNEFRQELMQYVNMDNAELIHAFRERFLHRMYNLSEFVRTLKHRFSLWYNKCKNREGPLWTGRFKSVLVQSSADEKGCCALSLMAAYIDLNAVRAELVSRAQDYPWCGFSDALAGVSHRLKALKYVLGRAKKRGHLSSTQALEKYTQIIVNGFPSKIDQFSAGVILGQHSFVDFVTRRRPECFRTGFFDITESVSALPESGLFTVRTTRRI